MCSKYIGRVLTQEWKTIQKTWYIKCDINTGTSTPRFHHHHLWWCHYHLILAHYWPHATNAHLLSGACKTGDSLVWQNDVMDAPPWRHIQTVRHCCRKVVQPWTHHPTFCCWGCRGSCNLDPSATPGGLQVNYDEVDWGNPASLGYPGLCLLEERSWNISCQHCEGGSVIGYCVGWFGVVWIWEGLARILEEWGTVGWLLTMCIWYRK